MRSVFRWVRVAVALLVVTLPSAVEVEAKGCTSTQLTQIASVATTYSSSPDCAGSALDSTTNTVAVICAGACLKLVRQLQPDTPDCEYEGTNFGESMEQLVSWCDAASSPGSASASSASLGSAAGSTAAGSSSTAVNMMDTVPICTLENVSLINDINSEAATNADCLGSAGAVTGAAYCDEDACVAYVTGMESRLPNCTYGGYNIKQVMADTLALCDDAAATSPSATPTATQATTTIEPTATTQTTTAASSASSQTTDTRAPPTAESAASTLKPSTDIAAVGVLLLTAVFARNSL